VSHRWSTLSASGALPRAAPSSLVVTLNNGPRASIADETFSKAVPCYVGDDELRRAGQWVGLRVVATGEVNRSDRPMRDLEGLDADGTHRCVRTVGRRAGRARHGDGGWHQRPLGAGRRQLAFRLVT
jgi:hypothetical protein